jgi:endoglucanase
MSLDTNNVLKKVTSMVNIGNYDNGLTDYLCNTLKLYTDDVYCKNGNIIANFGTREDGKPHLLLDAHLDQVGMVVTYITFDGFIKFSNVGGIDKRLLPAQEVTIHGKEDILGIVSTLPPHLKGSSKDVAEIDDLCIDTGYSKEKLEEYISVGDYITFRKDFLKLIGDRVSAKSLDDRSGIVTILKVVDILRHKKLKCSYSVMFSSQEEVGERGASIGAYDINPTHAIAIDVSFALTNDEKPHKCGMLGGGAMIGFSPVLNRKISKQLVDIAKEWNIPYQQEVMSDTTGTNADRFSITREGVKTGLVSIPLKYMHTPNEVISIRDIENTSVLVAEYIRRLG